ncbi:hypothetical protein ACFL09_04805 [Planctomycetota bacterium]
MIDEELEFKLEQLDLMLARWKRLSTLYRKISKPGQASPKEEREYAELSTYFSRTYQAIALRCGLKVAAGSSIVAMVSDVPDADAIRELSDMQRRKFEGDWRTNNAAMNEKLGELQIMSKELEGVSEFSYYGKRFFSNRAVQWSVGLSIVVILLGVFGVFKYLYNLAMAFVENM